MSEGWISSVDGWSGASAGLAGRGFSTPRFVKRDWFKMRRMGTAAAQLQQIILSWHVLPYSWSDWAYILHAVKPCPRRQLANTNGSSRLIYLDCKGTQHGANQPVMQFLSFQACAAHRLLDHTVYWEPETLRKLFLVWLIWPISECFSCRLHFQTLTWTFRAVGRDVCHFKSPNFRQLESTWINPIPPFNGIFNYIPQFWDENGSITR